MNTIFWEPNNVTGIFFCAWFLWFHLILKTLWAISMIMCVFLEEIDAHKLIITKNAIIQPKLASLHNAILLAFSSQMAFASPLKTVFSHLSYLAYGTHTGTLLRLAKHYIVSTCYLILCQAVTNKLTEFFILHLFC